MFYAGILSGLFDYILCFTGVGIFTSAAVEAGRGWPGWVPAATP